MTEDLRLDWPQYQSLVDVLCDKLVKNSVRPDLIVGISRGGLPLAVQLSHRLGCRPVGLAIAGKTADDAVRSAMRSTDDIDYSGLLLPALPAEPGLVLVVDDVVAKGDIFALLEREIAGRLGSRPGFAYACLYADTVGIAAGEHARLLDDLSYGADIDNAHVWVTFPWEAPVDA